MQDTRAYDFIRNRIHSLRQNSDFPCLQNKTEDYIFSAVFLQAIFYQNPALSFSDLQITEAITDGMNDGGIDILFIDPNSEGARDLVIGQGKFYKSISKSEIENEIRKMYGAFKSLETGKYEEFNSKVQSQFTTWYPEASDDESKIVFCFYTSAPKSGIKLKSLIEKVKKTIFNSENYEIKIYFGDDIETEIKEFLNRRDYIELAKIKIDEPHNYLEYRDAIIVNASAFSLKDLYVQHGKNLLAKNLRYHVKGPSVDKDIKNTIENDPYSFWYKNNGITIICEDFCIDGKEVKLENFSIINGAQTTHMIGRSKSIDKQNDIYLPCKIIKSNKETSEENEDFIFDVAIATNSQKPIKPSDLKANAPEQTRFKEALLGCGIYYQTKRGENIPTQFRSGYLNTKLADVGKLYLAAFFQMPGTSRSKYSSMYNGEYYDKIFQDTQNRNRIAKIYKELLYMNFYFRDQFIKLFENEYKDSANANIMIPFAKNSRPLCIAFTMFASRYYHGSIQGGELQQLFDSLQNDEGATHTIAYNIFSKNINMIEDVLPVNLENKDIYDTFLYKIFKSIIKSGTRTFTTFLRFDKALNATNFLKKDKNYYNILSTEWNDLEEQINDLFSEAEEH